MAPHVASNTRALVFAGVLAAVLGLLVSTAANLLAPRIAANAELERKHNVLIATRLVAPSSSPGKTRIEQLYRDRIQQRSVRARDGERPVFVAQRPDGTTAAVCLPLEGPGLWGPIRGYLSLDRGGRRIVGVTFYEHRETPGLGAQIAAPAWTRTWRGKSIVDANGKLTAIRITKGAYDRNSAWHVDHAVDGISGATITSKAVESIVTRSLDRYRPYLEELWRNN